MLLKRVNKIIAICMIAAISVIPIMTQSAYAAETTSDMIRSISYEEYLERMNEEPVQEPPSISRQAYSSNEDDGMKSIAKLAENKEVISYTADSLTYEAPLKPNGANDSDLITALTAPRVSLSPVIMNPETLKNGLITTKTQIAWLWDYQDDDNDTLLNRYLAGFPDSYLLGVLQGNIGFVTQFSNVGEFDVLYQVMDSAGELSNVVWYTIEVVPYENYEIIQSRFAASSEEKSYQVTIDFTNQSQGAVALVQKNYGDTLGGISMKVYDENGVYVAGKSVDGRYPKAYVFVNKPAGVTGEYTYTVTLKSLHEGDFNLAYGSKKDVEYMLGGQKNAVWIDKYLSESSNRYYSTYTPNREESWFHFRANSTTVFTILGSYSQTRFQIRDINTLDVLFDSSQSDYSYIHKSKYVDPFKYGEKARLTMTAGQEYYLVIKPVTQISTIDIIEESMSIAVGEPHYTWDFQNFYSTSSITATPTAYSPTARIVATNLPTTSKAQSVYLKSTTPGTSMSLVQYYRVAAPGMSYWKENTAHNPIINFDYKHNSVTNISAYGTWQFSFKISYPDKSFTMVPGLQITYQYEMGD